MKYAKRFQFSLRAALGILTTFCIVFGLMTALGVLPVAVMAVLFIGIGLGTCCVIWALAERFGSPTPEKPLNPRVRKALLEWRKRQREVHSGKMTRCTETLPQGDSRHESRHRPSP